MLLVALLPAPLHPYLVQAGEPEPSAVCFCGTVLTGRPHWALPRAGLAIAGARDFPQTGPSPPTRRPMFHSDLRPPRLFNPDFKGRGASLLQTERSRGRSSECQPRRASGWEASEAIMTTWGL